jgi:hypothetical protein
VPSSVLTPKEPRRSLTADRAAGLSTVPADAMFFESGPFQFADGEGSEGKTPVKMRARSGQPLNHWYWGRVVHDMAGFAAADKTIPIDYCHLNDEVLGYLDKFTPSNDGLDVAGSLVQFGEDRSAEVVHKAKAGVPYQASIFFEPQVLEDVMPGAETEVNGYKLAGPALVIRKWSLRGVAVCPYGYDPKTSTRLSAGLAGEVPVQFTSPPQETAMSTEAMPAADTKPADTKPAELATKPAEGPFDADPLTKFRAELQKYSDAFGAENGLKWFNEGVSFEAALGKHVEAITIQHASQLKAKDATISAQQAEIDGLKQKLSAVPRGEAEPVSFASGDKHEGAAAGADPSSLKFKLGDNLAKVAAGIKLPGKK